MGLYDYDPNELTRQAKVRAGTSSTGSGLSGSDWTNIGLQVLGGYLQDNQSQKAAAEKAKREDEAINRNQRQTTLQQMIDAQHWNDQQNQQTRTQNLAGLNYLANMRGQAQQEARRRSFRDTLLKAGA